VGDRSLACRLPAQAGCGGRPHPRGPLGGPGHGLEHGPGRPGRQAAAADGGLDRGHSHPAGGARRCCWRATSSSTTAPTSPRRCRRPPTRCSSPTARTRRSAS
jgi:hypothetical protein